MKHYTDEELILFADSVTSLSDEVKKHLLSCKVCNAKLQRFFDYKKEFANTQTPVAAEQENIFELYPIDYKNLSLKENPLAASTLTARTRFKHIKSFAFGENIIMSRVLFDEHEKDYLVHLIGENVRLAFAMFSFDDNNFYVTDDDGIARIKEQTFAYGKNCKVILPVLNELIPSSFEKLNLVSQDNTIELLISESGIKLLKGNTSNIKICLYRSDSDYMFLLPGSQTELENARLLVYKI